MCLVVGAESTRLCVCCVDSGSNIGFRQGSNSSSLLPLGSKMAMYLTRLYAHEGHDAAVRALQLLNALVVGLVALVVVATGLHVVHRYRLWVGYSYFEWYGWAENVWFVSSCLVVVYNTMGLTLVALTLLMKWTLVGRMEPGTYAVTRSMVQRHALAKLMCTMASQLYVQPLLTGTIFHKAYLRLLGMKAAWSASIGRHDNGLDAFGIYADLVTVADDVNPIPALNPGTFAFRLSQMTDV